MDGWRKSAAGGLEKKEIHEQRFELVKRDGKTALCGLGVVRSRGFWEKQTTLVGGGEGWSARSRSLKREGGGPSRGRGNSFAGRASWRAKVATEERSGRTFKIKWPESWVRGIKARCGSWEKVMWGTRLETGVDTEARKTGVQDSHI